VSSDGVTDISFTVPREQLAAILAVVESTASALDASGVEVEERVGKVSIVGAGMRSHPGVAATMFSVLADSGINIDMITTSSIRVSCVIAEDDVEEAVRRLHAVFDPPTTEMPA
jgi:aspartate kinase